jgi:hypothetical protein
MRETRSRASRIRRHTAGELLSACTAIVALGDVTRIAGQTAQEVARAMNCRSAAVIISNPDSGESEHVASAGESAIPGAEAIAESMREGLLRTAKLGASDRAHAVSIALRQRLIE